MNDNDLPHDWDLDAQYEDRFACLGDETTDEPPYNEDLFLQENWPELGNDDEDHDYGSW